MRDRRLLWLLCLVIAGAGSAIAEEHSRAITTSGQTLAGRLSGNSPNELRFHPSDAQPSVPVRHLLRIERPEQLTAGVGGAWRQFWLAGGECLSGTLVSIERRQVTADLRGVGRVTLPASALAAVATPAGLEDVLFRPGISWPLRAVLEQPVSSGLVSFDIAAPHDDHEAQPISGWTAVFAFQNGADARELVVECRQNGRSIVRARPPDARLWSLQTLPVADGGTVSLQFDENRTVVALGDRMIAAGPSPGRLTEVRLTADAADDEAPSPAVSRLVVRRVLEPSPLPPRSDDYDVAVLAAGDRLFGRLMAGTRESFTLKGAFGEVRLPWTKTRALLFHHEPAPAGSVAGLVARIELQPVLGGSSAKPEWLIAAMTAAADDRLTIAHPLLGERELALDEMRRIEPLFEGRLIPLTFETLHLGDEVRPSFQRPQPQGTDASGTFDFDAAAHGDVFFTGDVSEMEPSSTDTPLGSPWLAELRAGFLLTELFINGRRLGSLNERLRFRPPSERPQQIEIPVPQELLRKGENRWELRQRASRSRPANYDDCEIVRAAINIRSPSE